MVFPIAVVEGPIISVLSGFLVSTGVFNLYIVFLVLVFGDLVGDSIYYFIGRYGGRKAIKHVGRYIGVTEKRVSALEKHFNKHDWKILLFGKTQAMGSVILFTAGLSLVSFSRFVFYNIVGTVPKVILLMIVGFYFGRAYLLINTYLGYFAIVWLLVSFGLLALYFYFKKYITKKNFSDIEK